MKTEITAARPAQMPEDWPGQFDTFTSMEARLGIPHPLFLITTLKENGNVNAALHGWSAFSGDAGGMYAILGNCFTGSHTYQNILRDRAFCINFMRPADYAACQKTIEHNSETEDELMAAGLTAEPSQTIRPPRIQEAFLCLECTLADDIDPSGLNKMHILIGKIMHAAVDPTHHRAEDFMAYIYASDNPETGEGTQNLLAEYKVIRDA